MGKSQKKRAMRRHNPVRVPDSHLPKGLASASSTSTKQDAIPPIIHKMESPEPSDRKWACVAVSNIIQNDPSTRRLLQGNNIVGALISRLTDSEEEVVFEAMGALRNLCIDGGYDICAEMYNKNILTPLKTFIPKIANSLAELASRPKDSPLFSFADNVITTLWCLSETSNKALNAINAMNLVPFLMSFLISRNDLSLIPVLAAAQCLYVLTDDNDPAIIAVKTESTYVASLLSISLEKDATTVTNDSSSYRLLNLRVLCCGILRNISYTPPTGDLDQQVLLPLLTPVISSLSPAQVANEAQVFLAKQAPDAAPRNPHIKTPKPDHKSSTELGLELLEAKLRIIQLSLEILTGTCATLPEPDPPLVDEDPAAEDDAIVEDDAMEVEEAAESASTSLRMTAVLPSLVPPLLTLVQPTPLSFPPLAAVSPYPPLTSALGAVHICALECLSNIFLGLSVSGQPSVSKDSEAGQKVWNEVWSALSLVGTETGLGQERRRDMWSIAVGVLWGVGNVWKGSLIPNEEQVKLLIQLYAASDDTQLRVKCVGTLECLAHYPSKDSNRVISEYLTSLLPTTEPVRDVEPVLQSASALIDIFSDEGSVYDTNFRQGNYLTALVGSVESIKKAVKTVDKRKSGGRELRRRGEEVLENLVAFIDYRKNLRF